MNKPQVESLIYKVIFSKDVDYDKAPPLKVETNHFICTIDQGKAAFEMKTHFQKEVEAKKVTDDFLKMCTVYWNTLNYLNEITFSFQKAKIIDLEPEKSNSVNLSANITMHLSCEADIHISRAKFPSVPQDFTLSPDIETIFNRYKGYLDNREKLTSMAFFCLTVLEQGHGRKERIKIEKKYQIELAVLNKWGELVSEKGSETEARKAIKNNAFTPLTNKEQKWLLDLIKKIIIRLGNYTYNPSQTFPKITLNDLPDLS